MTDTGTFLTELARQIKRHPQSYPTWLQILAQDIIETTDNLEMRRRASGRDVYGDPEAARRFLGGDS